MERLEDPVAGLGVHAAAAVLDGEKSVPAASGLDPLDRFDLFDRGRDHPELPAPGHRVAGVGDQVGQRPTQVVGVDLDRSHVVPRGEGETNGAAREVAQRRRKMRNEEVHVHLPGAKDLKPAEGEQLPGQLRRAFPRPAHFFDVRTQRIRRGYPGEEQFAIPGHHGHQVVQVMRHPAGQAADCLELLDLPQALRVSPDRLLRLLLRGDVRVGAGGANGDAPVVPQARSPAENPAVRTVLVAEPVLHFEMRGFPLEILLMHRHHPVEVLRVDPRLPLLDLVGNLVRLIPEDRFPPVGEEDISGDDVPVPDPVVGAFQGKAVSFLALPQCGFRFRKAPRGVALPALLYRNHSQDSTP